MGVVMNLPCIKGLVMFSDPTCFYRCCPSYVTAESAAICTILNGIDVLVATPPSVLRLVDREIINLSGLEHVVSLTDEANE